MNPTEHEMTVALDAAAKAHVAQVVSSQQDRALTPEEADEAYRSLDRHTQYRIKNTLLAEVTAALDAFAPLHEQRVRAEAEQPTEYGRP